MLVRVKKSLKFAILVTAVVCFITFTKHLENPKETKRGDKEPCVSAECMPSVGSFHRTTDAIAEEEVPSLNNEPPIVTAAIHPEIVVYNRVPKCASSTMRWLIARMQKLNHFHYEVHNWPNVKQSLSEREEEKLVKDVSSLNRPLLFLRHLHFVDFAKYNVTQPVYINIVRNPIDRFVSHYYFSRFGFVNWSKEKIEKWLSPMSEKQRNISIDECVMTGAEKCLRDNRENMIEFFCGQDERCRKHDDWALEQAKHNVAHHYAFIGILEELEDSVKVAEAILPGFFRAASRAFLTMSTNGISTKTARKVNPSEKARAQLRTALGREIELYDFIKQRLHMQVEALKSAGKIS